ncbi:glyoxylase-like metal-dependent hydrolase (beta-lactamase superfamily II) [Haloferula luteola]|uniref:Glyoxylase-like metal-dependent hydrolase (Beta-lactamase superfamily II) n=1 Tax=Haloferula luteola TaxID=595692 RepID=A0A840V025_9BACT|nr:MBL fold metallo-hydrolase [Haloferula luteola]MBB5351717.1 glyoxylase-like metal-dependent hydrolase (beta-lactamase superfamily II) [Haloferula luteola]
MPALDRRTFLGSSLAAVAAGFGSSARAVAAEVPGSGVRPFVYPFRIGDAQAWSISDANLMLGEGLDLMWPQEDHDRMRELLATYGEPAGPLPLYVNVLVVRHGKETILFDAGFGAGGNPQLGWLMAGLQEIGVAPEDITAGFLSHAHADHLNGFVADGKPAFPRATFHLLPEELAFWQGEHPDFSKSKRDPRPLPGMVEEVRRNFAILAPHTRTVKDGETLLDGLVTVHAAPGHTDGHACYRIRSGNDELLHLMDLAHHHLLMFADPEWTIAFDHDPQTAVVTRKRFWAEAAKNRTRCYGFHLPWPGLGHIVQEKPGYHWQAEPWRWLT